MRIRKKKRKIVQERRKRQRGGKRKKNQCDAQDIKKNKIGGGARMQPPHDGGEGKKKGNVAKKSFPSFLGPGLKKATGGKRYKPRLGKKGGRGKGRL